MTCFDKLIVVDTQKPDTNWSENPSAETAAADAQDGQLAAITAERDRLAAEKAELQDRLLRGRAEFDNFRRRAERERSEYLQFAAMDAVRDILPVVDDFQRALQIEATDKEYARGIELIYNRLYEILRKSGLENIETVGKVFDPNIHEAVQRVHTNDAEDQVILEELQKGYNFKGKLLRPAWVKVAVKP